MTACFAGVKLDRNIEWPLLRGPSQVFASNTVWVASVAETFAGVCIKHSVGGLCCGDLRRCLHQTVWVASVAGTFAGVCIKHSVGGLCCGDLRRCSYKHGVGGLCCGDLRRCLHQTQCG